MELRRQEHALAAVLLLLAIALVYGRVGGYGYAAVDDPTYMINNAAVRAGLSPAGVAWAFTAFYAGYWAPLTWISLMLDVSLFGLDPGAQHLVNVAIHGANSLLVYALALALLRQFLPSLIVAFLFAVHPQHVESVAWITERKDVLCGFFFLLTLLAYLRYAERPSVVRYVPVLCAFALALLAKPMAITLPLVLLLLDYWPLERWSGRSARWGGRFPRWVEASLEKAPLAALSLASALVTLAAVRPTASTALMPIAFRFGNAAVCYANYLLQLIAPINLAVIYPLHSIHLVKELAPALLALGGVSAAAWRWRERAPWLLFGWLWFLVMLVPVIGLVQSGTQARADRYMYLPSLGPFLALGAAVAAVGAPARARAVGVLVPVLAWHSVAAWVQVGYWSSTETLARHALEVVGDSFPLHTMLVGYYLEEGQVDAAEAHAIEASKLTSGSDALEAVAFANLGTVMLNKQQYSAAERMFRSALGKAPHAADTLNNLGIALEKQGRRDEAATYFAAALEAEPSLLQARENLKRVAD